MNCCLKKKEKKTQTKQEIQIKRMNTGAPIVKYGNSSLPLQVMVYFNWHYIFFFFFLNICLFTYKSINFYYPPKYLAWDLVTIFLYLFVESVRLLLVSKGNKTSTMAPLGISWALASPIIVLHAYYMSLQTYILRIDLVINSLALVFVGLETIGSVFVFLTFLQASRRF